MDYMVEGLISMMRDGLIDPVSDIADVRRATDEPDVWEMADDELAAFLAEAKRLFEAAPASAGNAIP